MKAPSRILVGLDDGPLVDEVWSQACALSRTFAAELAGVHVIGDRPRGSREFAEQRDLMLDLFDLLRRQALAIGAREPTLEVRDGAPARTLVEYARSWQADLLVLGALSKRPLQRLLLGSTAEEVLREAPMPVWVVRPGGEQRGLPERILCAVDDSAPAREALAAAVLLAREGEAALVLLHVLPEVSPAEGDVDEREPRTCLDAFDLHGMQVETLFLEGDRVDHILEAAQRERAALVVLGEAGRAGIWRLLRANTAEQVVRRCPCSLLAVKADPGL